MTWTVFGIPILKDMALALQQNLGEWMCIYKLKDIYIYFPKMFYFKYLFRMTIDLDCIR